MEIEVLIANIANQPDIEAIVNSANANLRLGSGVAGAIHEAAGPELEKYCEPYSPLGLGKSILTPAFNLPNKYVIHTRAAHYLFDENPERVFQQCMDSIFELTKKNNIRSLALPAIGTGVFRFPAELCATAMVQSFQKHVNAPLHLVRVCVVNSGMQSLFLDALDYESLPYK